MYNSCIYTTKSNNDIVVRCVRDKKIVPLICNVNNNESIKIIMSNLQEYKEKYFILPVKPNELGIVKKKFKGDIIYTLYSFKIENNDINNYDIKSIQSTSNENEKNSISVFLPNYTIEICDSKGIVKKITVLKYSSNYLIREEDVRYFTTKIVNILRDVFNDRNMQMYTITEDINKPELVNIVEYGMLCTL